MYDFITIGAATQDVFVKSDHSKIMTVRDMLTEKSLLCFDYGAKINISNVIFTTGGGATNTAVSLARQGFRTGSIFAVGEDNAADGVLNEMRKENVSTDLICRIKNQSTGYSVILTSFEGDRTVLTYRGANNFLCSDTIDWEKVVSTKWIHLGSLSGANEHVMPKLAEVVNKHKISLSFNPGSAQIKSGFEPLKQFLKSVRVLFLNKEEAEQLTGIAPTRKYIDEAKCTRCQTCVRVCPTSVFAFVDGHVRVVDEKKCTRCGLCVQQCPTGAMLLEPWSYNNDEILRTLKACGPELVVITDGKRGAQVYDGVKRYVFPSFDVPVISTLGAGDSFASAFIGGLERHEFDIKKALINATANAASVVQNFGGKTGLLGREDLDSHLGRAALAKELDVYQIN